LWFYEEPSPTGTFIGSLKNSLRKWFFREPWFERFFVDPEMVLLWHRSEEPFSVPDGTSMVLCVVFTPQNIQPPKNVLAIYKNR